MALITLGQCHPVQVQRQASLGQQGYGEQFWATDDIFYGHVLSFKEVERHAVLLYINRHGNRDTAVRTALRRLVQGHRPAHRGRRPGRRPAHGRPRLLPTARYSEPSTGTALTLDHHRPWAHRPAWDG